MADFAALKISRYQPTNQPTKQWTHLLKESLSQRLKASLRDCGVTIEQTSKEWRGGSYPINNNRLKQIMDYYDEMKLRCKKKKKEERKENIKRK